MIGCAVVVGAWPGCCGEDEAHRRSVRHEDPQQMGDAQARRGNINYCNNIEHFLCLLENTDSEMRQLLDVCSLTKADQ